MNTIFLRSFLFFQHIKVIPCSQTRPEKVIILAPHPDDETVSCGGALQAHLEHGDQVSIIVLTDGSASSKQIEDLVKIRENEVKKAVGGIFGLSNIEFWGYPDKHLHEAQGVTARIEELFRRFQPTIVYISSAWDLHPDHIATARLILSSLNQIQGVIRVYESFCPHTPLWGLVGIDVTRFEERKLQAFKIFLSQVISFEAIAILNAAHASCAHQHSIRSLEVFMEVAPSSYPALLQLMTETPIQPSRITNLQNLFVTYLINFYRSFKLRNRIKAARGT